MMKVVDVPWFHDKKKVIKDRNELRKEFATAFDAKNFQGLKCSVDGVVRVKDIRDKLNAKEKEMLDEVLNDRDVIVARHGCVLLQPLPQHEPVTRADDAPTGNAGKDINVPQNIQLGESRKHSQVIERRAKASA